MLFLLRPNGEYGLLPKRTFAQNYQYIVEFYNKQSGDFQQM